MQCTTLDRVEENGVMVMRPKKQFPTLDAAIAVAKIDNAKDDRDYKVVAYKCNVCFKYHVGRNGKPLTDKERAKRKKELDGQAKLREYQRQHPFDKIKVVGFIDLNKIRY